MYDEQCPFLHALEYQGLPHPGFSIDSQYAAFTKEQLERLLRMQQDGKR